MNRTKLFMTFSVAALAVAAYNAALTPVQVTTTTVVSAAEGDPVPVPIVETEELMKLLVDPTFESLKDAIETQPEARKDWRTLYIAAFNLAEISNLYLFRNDHDYMTTPEWKTFAAQARDEVVDLAKAVVERPEHGVLKEKFMVVMETCNECHAKFAADEEIDLIEGPLSWQGQ